MVEKIAQLYQESLQKSTSPIGQFLNGNPTFDLFFPLPVNPVSQWEQVQLQGVVQTWAELNSRYDTIACSNLIENKHAVRGSTP